MIKINNLTKKYLQSDHEIIALNDVSFEVKKGEFIALVGESGAGKSTLFHLLAGIDTATSGEILVNGQDILKMKKNDMTKFRRSDIGLIYQFYNLVPILTVEENITLPKRLSKEKVDKEKLDVLLEKLNLTDRRNHLPNELSGGQQQRVAIARVLYSEPSIILADEPTGNLDQKNIENESAKKECKEIYFENAKNGNIKEKRKKIHFKNIENELVFLNITRQRKHLRATIISIILSIVLFLSMDIFCDGAVKQVKQQNGKFFEVTASIDKVGGNEIFKELLKVKGVKFGCWQKMPCLDKWNLICKRFQKLPKHITKRGTRSHLIAILLMTVYMKNCLKVTENLYKTEAF